MHSKRAIFTAEFIGTFGIVFFGCGGMIAMNSSSDVTKGVGINLVFGAIVAACIFAFGGVSGAHFNPAVTFGLIAARRFPLREAPLHLLSQCSGAITASAVHLACYGESARQAKFGATLPSGGVIPAGIMEFVLTFSLMFLVLTLVSNPRLHAIAAPLAIGLQVFVSGVVGGPISGCSMNPARSLAPALFSGTSALESLPLYLIVPVVAAFTAAVAHRALFSVHTFSAEQA